MNSHITELVRGNLPPDFIDNDAPDLRLASGKSRPIFTHLPRAAVGDTAAVTCVVFLQLAGRWRAHLAFEQQYVGREWVHQLLDTLCDADLPAVAALCCQPTLAPPPHRLAVALLVRTAGREDAHLFCRESEEPTEWLSMLDDVVMMQSQERFCSTLTCLCAFRGDRGSAEWMVEHLKLTEPDQC